MTDTQKDTLKESISALVDGEMDDLELRRVLKEAQINVGVRETWRRYHLIGAIVRGEISSVGAEIRSIATDSTTAESIQFHGLDVASRVRQSIEHEGESQSNVAAVGAGRAIKFWRDGMGKVAIAATVAFGVLISTQQVNFGGRSADEDVAGMEASTEQGATVFAPAGFQSPNLSARPASVGSQPVNNTSYLNSSTYRPVTVRESRVANDQELQTYLNHVLLKHAQQASNAAGLGVVPMARVSKLDKQKPNSEAVDIINEANKETD